MASAKVSAERGAFEKLLLAFGRRACADELVDRDAEDLGDLDKDRDIGEAIALFISGHRLSGQIQAVRQLGLRHVRVSAENGKIGAKKIGVKHENLSFLSF